MEEKKRVATYLEPDLWKWLAKQAKKIRTTESALIRQILAEKMETSD